MKVLTSYTVPRSCLVFSVGYSACPSCSHLQLVTTNSVSVAVVLWLPDSLTLKLWLTHNTAVLFTGQPENATAQEGTTATFSCAMNNPSFEIVWYINDTDASYTEVQWQGVRIVSINQTLSQLEVNASPTNNNSYIHYTAFHFDGPPFIGFPSEKAFLRVEGK